MKKQELRKKIDDVKNLIKTNSKDSHYAETLINELLALDRESRHEPTLVHIPIDSIEKSYKGENFEYAYTKKNEAIFKTQYYTLICSSPFSSLNKTISEAIDYLNNPNEDFTEEYKEIMFWDMSATQWVLTLPLHAFDDLDFKFDLAKKYIEWEIKVQDKAYNAELQEETPELDREFENAMVGMETLRETLDEEIEEIKSKE